WHECRSPFLDSCNAGFKPFQADSFILRDSKSALPPNPLVQYVAGLSESTFCETGETPDNFQRIAASEISFGCTYRQARSYPIRTENAPVSAAIDCSLITIQQSVLPIWSADVIDLLCCTLSQEGPIC